MTWLRRTLVGISIVGVLVLAVFGGVLWLLGTQAGAEWLVRRLESTSAGTLDVGAVGGSMLGGLVLEDVHVRLARDAIDIATLRLAWNPSAALAGSLVFDTARASPVSYRRLPADSATESADGASLELPFTIRIADGELESLKLQTDEDALTFGATRFGASVAGNEVVFDDVTTESGGVVLAGHGRIGLTPVRVAADLDWSALIGDAPAAGHFTVQGDWPVLTLHHDLTAPFRSVADGDIEVGDIPRLDLAVEWQDLAVPGVEGVASPNGRATIAGAIDGYRFDAAGALVVDGREADFTAAGTGQAGLISLSSFVFAPHAATASGELRATGDVALDTREWSLAVRTADLDPGWWLADWPGRVTGSAHLRGRFAPDLAASVDDIDMRGELRGYRLKASGAVSFTSPGEWTFSAAHVESGPNKVDVDGRLGAAKGDELSLAVTADVAQIGLLWPELSGSLAANVMLGGTWRAPHGRGRLEARALEFRGLDVERVVASGEAGIGADERLSLDIEASKVERGVLAADAVHVTVDGRRQLTV